MTFLFVTQSPTATWWFPLEETAQIPHRKPGGASVRQYRDSQQKRRWLSTIAAILSALAAVCLLALTSSNGRVWSIFSPPRSDNQRSPVLRHIAESIQQLQENFLTAATVMYPASLAAGAKTLHADDPVAIFDPIQALPPALDREIDFELPGSLFSDAPAADSADKPRNAASKSRLARVTVYWPEEGDSYTRNRKSSTGVRLRDGHCAVDPRIIPYGSIVNVPGIGTLVAVDTGRAVISRRAARQVGRTGAQRKAIVIDIFCSSRSKAKALMKRIKHFAVVTWQRPESLSRL
jgi:3D (Asp-Asp-Asp) domain-containing protein